MTRKITFTAAAVAVLALTAGATGASAETHWQKHHPRRVEVNHRLGAQNRRIREERREGEITQAQANAMHAQDFAIRRQEAADAHADHGHITAGEQRQLNQEENGVARQIPH